jgi:hypothetical protein
MPRRRHPAGKLVDRRRPADLLQLAVVAQLLRDRQVVDLVVALVELQHRGEDRAMLLPVEVLRPQLLLHQQRVQVALVEQHGAQNRLLGLQVVGRNGDVLDSAHGLTRV